MKILDLFAQRTGQIALLIDPEKSFEPSLLEELVKKAEIGKIDFLFVGGSTVTRKAIEEVVLTLKKLTKIPVILFPGASHQLSKDADALLFLNLISGRNPDYLIGHQVAGAEEIFDMPIEVISTSYLLIDGGTASSVAYVSQTTPIPQHQVRIATNTAKAGFLMGHQVVYMDAGSGAKNTVPIEMIESISQSLASPLIVGGGIRSIETVKSLSTAGVNVIVIGNKIESDIDFLLDLGSLKSASVEKNEL
jgi:putative glycerol-1-phosphate prenyltransferase